MNNTLSSNNLASLRGLLALPVLLSVLLTAPTVAGEWTEEHIKREIAYMAKQLLDMSGKESVRIESPAFDKPFIGVCSEIYQEGVKLTCVTPGTQAAKAGLQTGDMVIQMKGQSFVNEAIEKTKKHYYTIVETMKTGDKIPMTLIRDGKTVEIEVTVGALSHPAYVLEVNR